MATDTRITLREFIAAHALMVAFVAHLSANPNMPDDHDMDHWSVTLYNGERRTHWVTPFSMGKGHNGKQPTLEDVLSCVASDCGGFEQSPDFEDWAGEYGYDTDSRKAKATFEAIEQQAHDTRSFLGTDAYHELLYSTDLD